MSETEADSYWQMTREMAEPEVWAAVAVVWIVLAMIFWSFVAHIAVTPLYDGRLAAAIAQHATWKYAANGILYTATASASVKAYYSRHD